MAEAVDGAIPGVATPKMSARVDRRSALDGAIFSKRRIFKPFHIHSQVEFVAILVRFPSLFSADCANSKRKRSPLGCDVQFVPIFPFRDSRLENSCARIVDHSASVRGDLLDNSNQSGTNVTASPFAARPYIEGLLSRRNVA
jgi:hypothetical protein